MKPILLLDVDGVLCPMSWQPGYEELRLPDDSSELVNPAHGQFLRDLCGGVNAPAELLWCSRREGDAPNLFGTRLGAPPAGHIPIGPGMTKTGAVQAWDAENGPHRQLIWVDDEHDDERARWASRRKGSCKLVRVNPLRGLDERGQREVRRALGLR